MTLNESQKRVHEKLKRELGDEILNALTDDSVIEIMLNSDNSLWIEKFSIGMQNIPHHSIASRAVIHTIASYYDTNVTIENPILECSLPLDGSRFEGIIPPIVSNPCFSIRKQAKQLFTLHDYLSQNILTSHQFQLIENAVKSRKNILIAGGTGSGKTTLTNAIIDSIVIHSPKDRLVILEDTAEIQCKAKNSVILRATQETSLHQLLKATMRLRPDRILIGEVRAKEALDLIKAWNTGHLGGVATIHSNSALSALIRLEQLISEATINIRRDVIAQAIDIIIFISKNENGHKVEEIIEVINWDFDKNQYTIRSL